MAQDFEETSKTKIVAPVAKPINGLEKAEDPATVKPDGENNSENELENYLKNNALKSEKNEDMALFKKHNIKVINYLSSGSFSRVYEVDFNGKWAVAKVTNSLRDVKVINDLYQLKDKLGDGAKHILNVYATFKDKDSQGNDIYIVVAEYLKPLNIHIKDLLPSSPTVNKPKSSKTFNFEKTYLNPEYVGPIIKEHLDAINNSGRITELKDSEFVLEVLNNALTQIAAKNDPENPTKMDEINHVIRNKLSVVMDAPSSRILATDLSRVFYGIINRNYFPTNSREYNSSTKIYDVVPETASLMKTLKLLSSIGFAWADLRKPNLRERSNGDIVISDPGMFGL